MGKKISRFILCCLLLFTCCCTQVFAAESNVNASNALDFLILPHMDYIAQAKGSLYIDSNGEATISCSVYGYQGTTTRVEITAKLQQYNKGKWVTFDTFSIGSDSHRTSLNETCHVDKGYTYRVHATIKAYSGSSVETRTVMSSEAKY